MSQKKSDSPSEHKKFIQYWCGEYKKKFGMKYSFSRGKDGKIVKTMLQDFGLENLCEMTDLFFETEEALVVVPVELEKVLSSSNAGVQDNTAVNGYLHSEPSGCCSGSKSQGPYFLLKRSRVRHPSSDTDSGKSPLKSG